jgi:hypothetical protein
VEVIKHVWEGLAMNAISKRDVKWSELLRTGSVTVIKARRLTLEEAEK